MSKYCLFLIVIYYLTGGNNSMSGSAPAEKRVFVEEQPIECIKQYYRYIHFQKIG